MGGRRGPDYEGIRAPPARFAVLPGHVDWKVERVTNSADSRYEVVEKIERAAEVAAHLDPRRRDKIGSGDEFLGRDGPDDPGRP